MSDAGYPKGADGFFASPGEGRVPFEIKSNAGTDFEAEMSVLANNWRTAGFDFSEAVNPAALVGDAQVRATFPSMFTSSSAQGEDVIPSYASVPGPENRWQGSNRGGWDNQDFFDLAAMFTSTLDRDRRNQQVIRLMQIYTDQMPWISLYFDLSFFAYVSALYGPMPAINVNAAEALYGLEKWELR